MPLSPGSRLGPYEILTQIGEGGMGAVYKARDTRLDRIVAVKVSQAAFSERFEREARAVAALNHPNICQLYDVGENYLVMEFVDGVPVSAPDSIRKLLDQAVQIADGLSAAHAAAIVHRDLKPVNILITGPGSGDPGRVKILDFGLAKSAADDLRPQEATRTMGITDAGTTVGTISYMSPEQARGVTKLTAQSDQFSFGLVLYEMCSGKRAFVRGSAAETMTAIIREDAEPLPASVAAPLKWVIERLLAKEPGERYDSTRDLYRELKHIRDHYTASVSAQQVPAAEPLPPVQPKRRVGWGVAVGLAAAGLAVGVAIAAALAPPAQPDLSKFKFTPISLEEGEKWSPAWSPDGKSIAYVRDVHGVAQIFTRATGAAGAAQLTHATSGCDNPRWSPDGATIYYASHNGLWKVASSGGAPELAMDNVAAFLLHPDGKRLLIGRDGKIWVGSLSGGAVTEWWWQPPKNAPQGASISADGSQIAYVDGTDLWIVPFVPGTAHRLGSTAPLGNPAWMPDGRHLVVGERNTDFSSTLSFIDVRDGRRQLIYTTPQSLYGHVSISRDGQRMAYAAATYEWDTLEVNLAGGAVRTALAEGGVNWWPDWAPSGTHYLVSTSMRGHHARIEDVSADGFTRVIAESQMNTTFATRWSPDGTRFAYLEVNYPDDLASLMIANASGGSATEIAKIRGGSSLSWSPDGQWLTTVVQTPEVKLSVAKIRASRGASPVFLAEVPSSVLIPQAEWSPGGDEILYPSQEGLSMVSPNGGPPRKISSRQIDPFQFTKDGRQIVGIFHNVAGSGAEWQIYSIDAATGAEKTLGALDLPASVQGLAGFSIHPDGKRALISVAKWPYDIWMLEGFDQQPRNWLDRILRR